MRTIFKTAVIIAAIGAMASCKKAKVDVDFAMDAANIYFVIDTTSTTGDVTFSSTQFNSELKAKLDDHDASVDDVQSIYITGAELVMVNPGSQNFDIVDKVNAYMSTASQPEVRVIYNDNVPDGVTSVSMNSDGHNLKEYLKDPVINFRASGFLSGANTQKDSIQAKITFRIYASVKP